MDNDFGMHPLSAKDLFVLEHACLANVTIILEYIKSVPRKGTDVLRAAVAVNQKVP